MAKRITYKPNLKCGTQKPVKQKEPAQTPRAKKKE